MDKGRVELRFPGGRTNICYNALDRNIQNGLGDSTALLSQCGSGGTTQRRAPKSFTSLFIFVSR